MAFSPTEIACPKLELFFQQANRCWLPSFHFCLKSATTLASIAAQSSLQLLPLPLANSA